MRGLYRGGDIMRIKEGTIWGEIDPDLSFLDHPAFPDSPHREEDSYADVLYKKWQNAEARVQELVKQVAKKNADLVEERRKVRVLEDREIKRDVEQYRRNLK